MSLAVRVRRPRAPPGYARHRPEATPLYQLVERHYRPFRELRAEAGRPLPAYVEQEFDAYLKCGRLEEGFLRARGEECHADKLFLFSCMRRGFCPSCGSRRMTETAALLADVVLPERPWRQGVLSLPHALRFLPATNPVALTLVLGVVYRTIARYLIGQAGLTRTRAATGAVTLIQRFGSALNLNIHFHSLLLDGVYLFRGTHPLRFRPVAGPSANELQRLVDQAAARVGQALERRGLIERDLEKAWLVAGVEAGPLDDLIGHSITYRIAVGPRGGQKLYLLHAGVDIAASEREKLERLCRYVSRPPVAAERLALTPTGQARYTLKSPYRDGTTQIVLEPLDFIARLAALVPPGPSRRL